jgi:ElaB/YqjD/DUF883 family membrane-anchored ribosome-binding protein
MIWQMQAWRRSNAYNVIINILSGGIMATTTTNDNEKLVKDFKAVVADVEAIMSTTAGKTGKEVEELRATMATKLANAKARLTAMEEAAVEKAKQAAKVTDEYVHENPWQSVIIAGGVGFLIGYLASRRD